MKVLYMLLLVSLISLIFSKYIKYFMDFQSTFCVCYIEKMISKKKNEVWPILNSIAMRFIFVSF